MQLGLKRKPTSIKNPQANAILEHVHQTIIEMICTAEIDMAYTVSEREIADFLTNAAWAICSTYHMVLKASPGAAIFGRDMLLTYFSDPWTITSVHTNGTIRDSTRNKSEHLNIRRVTPYFG